MNNPLLDLSGMPKFAAVNAGHVKSAIETALAVAGPEVDKRSANPGGIGLPRCCVAA